MAGLYIHLPFCKSRCIYCAFYSTTQHGLMDDYVTALCKEMELRNTPPSSLHTPHSTRSISAAVRPLSFLQPCSTVCFIIYIRYMRWRPMRKSPWSVTLMTSRAIMRK